MGAVSGVSVEPDREMGAQFAAELNSLLQSKGISGKELSRRVEVDAAQVGRWRRGLGLPRPDNIARLAHVLGVDYEWLMGIAFPETRVAGAQPPDLIETAIRARVDEMRAAVEGTPREFWATIIKATFDRAIDGARDMARLLVASSNLPIGQLGVPPMPTVRSARRAANRHASGGSGEITAHYLSPSLVLATP